MLLVTSVSDKSKNLLQEKVNKQHRMNHNKASEAGNTAILQITQITFDCTSLSKVAYNVLDSGSCLTTV